MKKIALCSILLFCVFSTLAADFQINTKKSKVIVVACCHAFTQDVKIYFEKYSASINYDQEKNQILTINSKIETNSLNSNSKRRDKHLRTDSFFAVKDYPEITFESTTVESQNQELFIKGVLTMKGVSKEILLQGKITNIKNKSFKIKASGEINSKDFGVGTAKQKDRVKIQIDSFFERK